jgi:hypothetical protein
MRAHHSGKRPDAMSSVEMRKRRPEIVPETRRRSGDALRYYTTYFQMA